MNKITILVDSTVDLNKEDYERLNITVLPLLVRMEGKEYLDGINITADDIYASVDKGADLPSTSTISSGQFEEAFKKEIDKGNDVIYIGIGSTLSGTFQAATIASREFEEGRIYLIDSKSLSSGSGLLVVKAAKLRDEGKSVKEIYDIVSELPEKVVAQFGLTRLDYMAKGGRCSGFANLMARLLHIHPLLRVVDGKLIVYRKPRGRVEAYFDELVELLKEDSPVDQDCIFITHSGIDDASVEYCKSKLQGLVKMENVHVTRAGAIISSHCGYGTLGILYIRK